MKTIVKPTKIRSGLYFYKGFEIKKMDNRGLDGGSFYGRSEIPSAHWNINYTSKDGVENPACEKTLKDAIEWCDNNLHIQSWMC